jgi:hypothetical protein
MRFKGGFIQRLLHVTHLSYIILLNDVELKLYPLELAFKHRRHRVDDLLADQINRMNCHFVHPKGSLKIKYLYSLIEREQYLQGRNLIEVIPRVDI